jgi:hypothetical protein
MGTIIHRKGTRYRLWSTCTDTYITRSMTRGQMAKYIMAEAIREFEANIGPNTEERMERAAKTGTSSRVGCARDATKWDTELCGHCNRFHHTFELRPSDGNCRVCGEPEGETSHKPPCRKKRARREPQDRKPE